MTRAVAARLLAWFDAHRRDLPWRRSRDPWAVWVSEIMLQQTRVEAVRESFMRFVARYPTPRSFARANDAQVLLAWRGLGYYRRARLLREGARAVVLRHDGEVPAELDALGELPGVGPYTRGAIASIAFDLPEIAVDGNVERVVARHRAIEAETKRGTGAARVREVVTGWLDRSRAGAFNQALMELGALVCTPRAPKCPSCPIRADCEARRRGLTDRLPVRPARRAWLAVDARCVLISEPRGAVLAMRVAEGEINAGQVDLPSPGVLVSVADAHELARALRVRFRCALSVGRPLARITHTITNHKIALTAHLATCVGRSRGRLFAAHPADPEIPWTTTARKVFQQVTPAILARSFDRS